MTVYVEEAMSKVLPEPSLTERFPGGWPVKALVFIRVYVPGAAAPLMEKVMLTRNYVPGVV